MQLPLPIGISFYTLQALSYVVDVYREEVSAQRNILYLGMYIACFPQLIAGPIVRYSTIQDQVIGRRETIACAADGLRLFIIGLAKKALLANTCAILATKMLAMGGPSIGAVGAWGGLIAYTFQIFFDFSGYSDMAIGLGRMMGFSYLRNFNYPYISKSITEFWRRWHMSLSTFFRDYVYIPLGGSRVSSRRYVFNILVVWAITGLWHGAAWNYVGWGVYYGVLLVCEKFLWGKALNRAPNIIGHIYTIAIFTFGWSFFWITDPGQLIPYWKALVGVFGTTGASTFWELTVWEYWPIFIICAAASVPIVPWVKERLVAWAEKRKATSVFAEGGLAHARTNASDTLCIFSAKPSSRTRSISFRAIRILVDIILVALLIASAISIVSGSFNPFIYFQF
ncbi:MAG: MBOAT family O-acyltransferase [Coriobacteriales bacterium]